MLNAFSNFLLSSGEKYHVSTGQRNNNFYLTFSLKHNMKHGCISLYNMDWNRMKTWGLTFLWEFWVWMSKGYMESLYRLVCLTGPAVFHPWSGRRALLREGSIWFMWATSRILKMLPCTRETGHTNWQYSMLFLKGLLLLISFLAPRSRVLMLVAPSAARFRFCFGKSKCRYHWLFECLHLSFSDQIRSAKLFHLFVFKCMQILFSDLELCCR